MFQIPNGFGGIKLGKYFFGYFILSQNFRLINKITKLIKEVRYENLQSCCDRR